jgi:dipeptide/tripeptide permease
VGRLWALNPFTIIILVPLVGALSQKISAYRMVVAGSIVAASSVFIMAIPPHFFQALADGPLGDLIAHRWLGVEGAVNPYYVSIFLYVLAFSLGEALYSPRLYEYAAAIAPKGQEASYMALSYLPFFLAKLFVGMFSGVLLARYCPASGPRHYATRWLIIALITVLAPIGLISLRRFIQVHEAGRD